MPSLPSNILGKAGPNVADHSRIQRAIRLLVGVFCLFTVGSSFLLEIGRQAFDLSISSAQAQPAKDNSAEWASKAKVGLQNFDHATAQLLQGPPVSKTEGTGAQTIWVGLLIKHDPQWHTYWKNPGDSGLATELTWDLPAGFRASSVHWPVPARIGVAHLANYGYEGDLLLPVKLEIPKQAVAKGESIPIRLKANWLICREVCIPGEGLFALDIKIGQATSEAVQTQFKDSLAKGLPLSGLGSTQVPLSAEFFEGIGSAQNPISSEQKSDPVKNSVGPTILIQWPPELAKPLPEGQVEFFPYVVGWVRPAAEQRISWDAVQPGQKGGVLRIDLELGDGPYDLKGSKEILPLGVLKIGDQHFEVAGRQIAKAPLAAPPAVWVTKVTKVVDLKGGKQAGLLAASESPLTGFGASTSAGPAANTGLTPSLGFGLALLFAFIGGLILNLMPCVLPVLGIKALKAVNRPEGMKSMALGYLIGVVFTTVLLGLALVLLRQAGEAVGWGFQMQSPPMVAALVLLFLLLALNLFGVFEWGGGFAKLANYVPDTANSSINNSTAEDVGATTKKEFGSGVVAGLVTVIAASPCSAPFMGSALGAAVAMPVIESLLIFLALGLGIALPLSLVFWFPSLRRWIPRPGGWMIAFKQFLGFPLLATVAWLLWIFNQLTGANTVFLLSCALVLASTMTWVYGLWQRRRYDSTSFPKILVALVMLCIVGLGYVAVLLRSAMIESEIQAATAPASGTQSLAVSGWQPYSAEILSAARDQGRPVFVDFTAAWCVSCQVNKKLVLENSRVQAIFKKQNVLLLRADWTKRDPAITSALSQLGRSSVPVYAVYTPLKKEPTLLPEILSESLIEKALR